MQYQVDKLEKSKSKPKQNIIFSLKNDTETVCQGARPDTYVDLQNQRSHPAFANQNLHLVEIRPGGQNTKTNAEVLKYYLNRAYNVQD